MKPSYINDLDEYFAATYSDYVRIAAIEGYQMPDLIVIGADGNVGRKNEALLRISYQKDKVLVLENFKRDLDDTFFQFSFSFRSIRDKFGDIRRKFTFAKILPSVLERSGETVESAGEKLSIKSEYWNKIVKGKLYPEKNTVLALSLVCRLEHADAESLFSVCGMKMRDDDVRDVVVGYLLKQKIFNEDMRDSCLREYKITCLPIKRKQAEAPAPEQAE